MASKWFVMNIRMSIFRKLLLPLAAIGLMAGVVTAASSCTSSSADASCVPAVMSSCEAELCSDVAVPELVTAHKSILVLMDNLFREVASLRSWQEGQKLATYY